MASADFEGRFLQSLTDRMTCLGMEMAESIREARERFDAEFPEFVEPDGTTTRTDEEQAHG